MQRTNVSSGTEWEDRVGYSRAVRVGPHVHVSGTTATDDHGDVVAPGDPAGQMRRAIENVEVALEAADASLAEVNRLVESEMLVELEVDAVVSDERRMDT